MNERGILYFDSVSDFPTVGDVRYYYVDETYSNWYGWDESTNAYVLKIDGSSATGDYDIKRTNTVKTANYTITDLDRNVECSGTFTITLPLLSTITHYDDIYIVNNGTGEITINTSGSEEIYDTTTFTLYPAESLCLQKGNTKWLAK